MTENLFKLYTERLHSDEGNKGKILASFFCELLETPFKVEYIVMFNKLIKLYGKESVFNSIIDLDNFDNLDLNKGVYGLLAYLSKKHALTSMASAREARSPDLSKVAEEKTKRDQEIKKNAPIWLEEIAHE